jgi:AcrR family transcriptional regulator
LCNGVQAQPRNESSTARRWRFLRAGSYWEVVVVWPLARLRRSTRPDNFRLRLADVANSAMGWTYRFRTRIVFDFIGQPAERRGMKKRKDGPPRIRDAEATQKRILAAAKREFAKNGLNGARVDVISERAKANKRMIYHYFNAKEELFQRVLEEAYLDIRTAEQKLDLEHLPPREALEVLIRFTWNYYLKNPEFLTLVNSENLHKARHLKKSDVIHSVSRKFVNMVAEILDRGVASGDFRRGIDPVQLNITIAAIAYYYLTNRFTGSIIFERNLMAPDALDERLSFNMETIMRLVKAD